MCVNSTDPLPQPKPIAFLFLNDTVPCVLLQVRSSEWIGFSCQALVPPFEPPLNCSHVVFVPKQPNTLFSEHLYKLLGLLMLAPLLESVGESKDLKMDLMWDL